MTNWEGWPVSSTDRYQENPLEIWKYGSGLDENINGYGLSIQIGAENAFALHLKNISLEMGTNSLGRVYGKYTHSVGDGYGYSKLSINFPEIMALAALVIHVPGVLGAIETIGAVISIFD